jgi:S1-C subfamily serine protease
MKLCPKCDQPVAEEITTCPTCGNEIGDGRKYIDDYRIVDVLHEGHASFLCRAIRERTNEHVMIRLFTPQSGVNEEVAARLMRELEELKTLPDAGFVRHYAIRRSTDGLWYRISEWVDTESWGSLLAAGRLNDLRLAFDLFYQMASSIAVLHQDGYFIPHLILNDIMAIKDKTGELKIKIDYKLSRFIDPKLDQPGSMLKRLLACHPDIVENRPLDFRSDIWSLGKIFVELLSADLEVTDFLAKVDELQIPPEAKVLFKVMLAEDPDLRPRSMTEVVESLARIELNNIQQAVPAEIKIDDTAAAAAPPARTIKGLQNRISALAGVVVLLIIVGIVAWFQLGKDKKDLSTVLEGYANQYAKSIAFVLAEYWLEADGEKVYRNLAEGTAFLVDSDGYLLTSRHVACPWLEDQTLFALVQQLRLREVTPRFGYRLFLWFEGDQAFNRIAQVMETTDISDVYLTDEAFSTQLPPRLTIAGVAKPPIQTRQVVISPLKDDYAALKIDKVPAGLTPLPLDLEMMPLDVPKLSRILILGFPLGRRTQDTSVNVSVTNGHVRRSFKNMIQVDASIYGGNSGGPIIDSRGKVIGIVSGVALDWGQGLIPMVSPRWDIGMILPIAKPVKFLEELKAGKVKWNGILDLSVMDTLKKIGDTANRGSWAEAMTLADKELKKSLQPALVMAAGMMHLCAGDNDGARQLFLKHLYMDADNYQARMMLYLIDWLNPDKTVSAHRQALLDLDWRSSYEFQGFLTRVLEGSVDETSALKSWYNEAEKSWLYYMVGLLRFKQGDRAESEKLLREAVLASDTEGWEYYVARARLEQLQKLRRKAIKRKKDRARYNADVKSFDEKVQKFRTEKIGREEKLAPLMATLQEDTSELKDRLQALEKIFEIKPDNYNTLAILALLNAADEAWPKALEYTRNYLEREGRPSSVRMSLGLLEPGILRHQGLMDEARAALSDYSRRTIDPWYLTISEYLQGKKTEEALKIQAGESPEHLLTGHTVLGFWAEGSGNKKEAIKHYKEALSSFLDNWPEYLFAKERFIRLKKPTE